MADKAKKGKNKNLITGICAGIVVIAVVVVVVVVALMGGNGGINDDYFVSDDTKAVITFDGDQASMIFGEGAPDKVHIVYTFDGDKVTSYKSYYEYSDNNAARGYYERLLGILDKERERYGILFPQVRDDHADIVENYMRASNNLGVTLYELGVARGNTAMYSRAIVYLQDSLRAWDALSRNQTTMVRLEGSNLAEQNIKYIIRPVSDYEPAIYTEIPRTLSDEEGLK